MTCPRTCSFLCQDKTLSHYNPFDTLPHSARNSENTDNWEQFLGARSYFHEPPPFRASPEPLNHRGEWVWGLLWQQICGPLKASESPDTHWVSSKSLCFWLEICGVSADSAGWGLKTVLNSAASSEVLSRSCLWSNGENWDVHDPPSKSTAQYNWWLNLGKTLAYTSQIIIQNVTQGSKMEEMCMQRGREVCPASVP